MSNVLDRRDFLKKTVKTSAAAFAAFTAPHQHGKLTNQSGKFIESLSGSMLGHFRRRGYRIGWVGKNHTYSKKVLESLDLCVIRAREPFRAYSKFVPPYWHSDTLWPEEKCHPRMNTDDAIKFINSAKKNEPFFLHISYFDPHPPYMAPSEYTSKYPSKEIVLPPFVHPEKLSARLDEQYRALHYDRIKDTDLTETMRYYYASIEWGVDYQVGRILETLRNKGLIENTIVVFTSDHGDFMGEHRMAGLRKKTSPINKISEKCEKRLKPKYKTFGSGNGDRKCAVYQ